MSRNVGVVYLGLCRYRQALQVQEYIAERFKRKEELDLSGVLIILEHPAVYTLGIRKEALKPSDIVKLKELGADVEYAGRGGLVTFHGPGQMVAWPILDLKAYSGVKKHIFSLEQSVIDTCCQFGLSDVGRNAAYPGVWRNEGKLCAVGVRASRYITTHGLALNVSTNLSWFDHIVPCGIQDKKVTSLSEELGQNINVQDVIPIFLKCFSNVFSSQLIEIPEKFDLAATNQQTSGKINTLN